MSTALWNGRRAPLILFGGYLGSGKTTIINHLLMDIRGRRVAVLVNDVGDINIDAELIANDAGETIELTNGCVCCSLSEGFAVALERLRSWEDPPDAVLVELSGVAEPRRVASWGSTAGFRYDGTIIAIDADQIRRRADDLRVGDLVRGQIADADLLVLTKTDLVGVDDADETATWVRGHSTAPLVAAINGNIDAGILLGFGAVTPRAVGTGRSTTFEHRVESIALDEPLSREDALRTLAELGPDVVRAKGFARSPDGSVFSLQRVGSRRSVLPHDNPDVTTAQLVVIRLPHVGQV